GGADLSRLPFGLGPDIDRLGDDGAHGVGDLGGVRVVGERRALAGGRHLAKLGRHLGQEGPDLLLVIAAQDDEELLALDVLGLHRQRNSTAATHAPTGASSNSESSRRRAGALASRSPSTIDAAIGPSGARMAAISPRRNGPPAPNDGTSTATNRVTQKIEAMPATGPSHSFTAPVPTR